MSKNKVLVAFLVLVAIVAIANLSWASGEHWYPEGHLGPENKLLWDVALFPIRVTYGLVRFLL